MGSMFKTIGFAASLMLIGSAAGWGAIPPARPMPAGEPAGADHGAYEPYRDPSIYFAEHAAEFIGESLFGWFEPSARWNLMLDAPPDADGFATGANDFGQPFTLDAALYAEHPVRVPGYAPGTCFRGMWSGVVSTSAGSVVAWGVAFRVPDLGTTIVPLIIDRDQDAALERFAVLVEAGRGVMRRLSECALDETAAFQLEQNVINATACVDTFPNWYGAGIVICTVVGGVTCWFTLGLGCVGAVICDVSLIASAHLWTENYYTEWARTRSCLCLETQWRADHPGQPLPAPSCAGFNCPPFTVLPVKL